MAFLRTEVKYRFFQLSDLAEQFPDLNLQLLRIVGKRLRTVLRKKYLSGQELDLRAFPVDKRGRHTITSAVSTRKGTVKLASYPMNFFERGRTLRDGRRESGKYVITRKLKQDASERMGGYVREFEDKILSKAIKDAGL